MPEAQFRRFSSALAIDVRKVSTINVVQDPNIAGAFFQCEYKFVLSKRQFEHSWSAEHRPRISKSRPLAMAFSEAFFLIRGSFSL